MNIYHIADQTLWVLALQNGVYTPADFLKEGFIHCSFRNQVLDTANRYFADAAGLVLLQIDVERLASDLVEENLDGGVVKFPHVYGSLNLDAVTAVSAFEKGPDGSFTFPIF